MFSGGGDLPKRNVGHVVLHVLGTRDAAVRPVGAAHAQAHLRAPGSTARALLPTW